MTSTFSLQIEIIAKDGDDEPAGSSQKRVKAIAEEIVGFLKYLKEQDKFQSGRMTMEIVELSENVESWVIDPR